MSDMGRREMSEMLWKMMRRSRENLTLAMAEDRDQIEEMMTREGEKLPETEEVVKLRKQVRLHKRVEVAQEMKRVNELMQGSTGDTRLLYQVMLELLRDMYRWLS